jgi:small multidrug resistance pump
MKWIFLAGAILSEVTASLSLKAALENPAFFIVVVVGYAASFGFLAGVLRKGLGLGVAYGIWAALGVTLTVLLAALIFGEALTPMMLIGVAMVIGGVLCVELGSHKEPAMEPEKEMVGS